MQSLNPELKTYYSKQLLSRLVPALEHAEHGVNESVPYQPTEYETAVRKWQRFFGDDGTYTENVGKWDDGYYHAILKSI